MASLSFFGWGQAAPYHHNCGTKVPLEVANLLKKEVIQTQKKLQKIKDQLFESKSRNQMMDFVPIKAHIIRKSNGSGGLTAQQLNEAIDAVNKIYAPANMQFGLCLSLIHI